MSDLRITLSFDVPSENWEEAWEDIETTIQMYTTSGIDRTVTTK